LFPVVSLHDLAGQESSFNRVRYLDAFVEIYRCPQGKVANKVREDAGYKEITDIP